MSRFQNLLRRQRGPVTAGLIALLIAIGLAEMRSTEPVIATSGGNPYSVPLVTDTNPSPTIVETTIVAAGSMEDIGNGVMASVLTFNGTLPGPEFRLKVGDTVIVHFQNNLGHASGIHWHGIELANASDGTPLTQNMVQPGQSFLYQFKVPRPGIYWYHPHHHSSTNQVFKGLYGSIIVTDPNEAPLQSGGTLPPASQTLTMLLSDLTICKADGSNDTATYVAGSPTWRENGLALPAQLGPSPATICEDSPIDEDGHPRAPFAAGDVPNIQPAGPVIDVPVVEGQTVLTNGMNVGGRAGNPAAPGALDPSASTYAVTAGQGLRLQFINAAATRFFRLRLTDASGALIPLVRVGGQGGLLDYARVEGGIVSAFDFKYNAGELLLDPGDRDDAVIAIPGTAVDGDVLTLWTMDFSRTGPGFSNIPTVPVAHFEVTGGPGPVFSIGGGVPLRAATGNPVPVLGPATAILLDPAGFLPTPKDGLATQDIRLTNAGPGGPLGINGIQGAHDPGEPYSGAAHAGSTRYAEIGETLQLTVTNVTNAHHPFHLHGFSIQPIMLTRPANPTYTFPAEFRDNVDVPAQYTLTFRVRLDDRPLMDGVTPGGGAGRWVLHCHIFFHAGFGMLGEFDVVQTDGNERPYINANETLVIGPVGDPLTVHGTYDDPDGDTPMLTASSGTIVDDGGGAWTWTRTGGTSGLVYVTATDPDGLKDQVAFDVVLTSPSNITATKTVSGTFAPGTPVTYTVTLTNSSASPQQDNPGDEFIDVLPPALNLVSATATSGTAMSTGTTVTWNGSISGGGSVTITINAAIGAAVAGATVVSNQGTLSSDADGNGTNEASGVTDDPGVAGAGNPTSFTVNTPPTVSAIADALINVNASATANFTVGDDLTAAGTLVVTGVSSAPSVVPQSAISFGGTGTSRSITVTPPAGNTGQTTISVTVSDGTLSTTEAFLLTINGPPVVTGLESFTMPENTIATANFTVLDDLTPAAALTVSSASSNTALVPNAGIVAGGAGQARTLTVTPAADAEGQATISVTVSDGTLTTTVPIVVTVAPASAPEPPTLLAATVSGATVSFTWNGPASGATPTFYVLEGGVAPGLTTLPVVDTPTSATAWTLTMPAGTFYFRARSGNSAGISTVSNEVVVQVGPSVQIPGPPIGLTVAVFDTRASASWRAPNAGSAVAGWQLELGTSPGGSEVGAFAVPVWSLAVSGNLTPGEYFVRVRGRSGAGTGPASNEVRFRVGAVPTCVPPDPPVLLPAMVAGQTMTLSWRAPRNAAIASYRLLAGSSPGASNLAVIDLGPVTSFVADAPAGTYYITLLAANACGMSQPSNGVSVVTSALPLPPPAPANVQVIVQGRRVTVGWDAVAGATSYLFEVGRTPGATAAVFPVGTPQFAIDNVPAGIYYVRIRAVGPGGTGVPTLDVIVGVP